MTVSVAVLIPTYNRVDVLPEAVESVVAQGDDVGELVIVDDGSGDGTADYLAELASRYAGFVRIIEQANAGKAAALNRGLAEITSSHVIVLDDDDRLTPSAVRRHREALSQAGDAAAFTYGAHYHFRDEGPTAHELAVPGWGVPAERLLIWAMESFRFAQAAMLVPREALTALGGFDTELARCQDYDMTLRLCRYYRGVAVPWRVLAVRDHEGPRGPAWHRHGGAERFRVWHYYDHLVLARLRDSLPLAAYLPEADAGPLTPAQQRLALLQRGAIMARRGLFAEGLADLRAAAALSEPPRGELDDGERALLTRALELGRYADLPPGTIGFFRRACGPYRRLGGRRAMQLMQQVLYWTFVERLQARQWREGSALGLVLAWAWLYAPWRHDG